MASHALTVWRTASAQKLDALIAAHASVGGTGQGRRYATAQLNASLIVQIAAHFQLFCRDLHTNAAEALVSTAPRGYRTMLQIAFTERRGLDRGNASAQTIGADFRRFGLDIWTAANGVSRQTATRRMRVEQLICWRNAISHQDFTFNSFQRSLLSGTHATLDWARRWRSACDALTQTFDEIVAAHVQMTAEAP